MQKVANISSSKHSSILVFYGVDGAYLIGYPKKKTV